MAMKTVVYAIHGILANAQKWAFVKRMLEPQYPMKRLCWKRDVESQFQHNFRMSDLKKIAHQQLNKLSEDGKQVILLSHSAGSLIGGAMINHPAVIGHLALAPAPPGIFLPASSTHYFNRGMLRVVSEVLSKDWTVFDTLCSLGCKDERESSKLLRGFVFWGNYLPKNTKQKNQFVHISDVDEVMPAERVRRSYARHGYHNIEGFNTFKHCGIHKPSEKDFEGFWTYVKEDIFPQIIAGRK